MKLTLVVKATEDCNANCVYCSVADKETKKERMEGRVLRLLISRVAEFLKKRADDDVLIIWHGGEPLLMGPDFYRKAHQLQQEILGCETHRLRHTFQTNLTLYTDEFGEVFRLLDVNGIGSSFEHQEGLRGMGVPLRSRPYDRRFFRGLEKIEIEQMFIGIIYVVTSLTLDRPVETLIYLANLISDRDNAGVRINPLYLEGEAGKEELQYLAVSAADIGHFHGKAFSYWLTRRHILPQVQPFSSVYDHFVKGHESLCCDDAGRCGNTHLGIGPRGEIYQCGRSMDSHLFCYGNLEDIDFEGVFQHPLKKLLDQRSQHLSGSECAGCRFFGCCHGGCPVDAQLCSGGPMHRSNVCETKRVFYEEYFEPLTGIVVGSDSGCRGGNGHAP
jgi:radical SAM protein with 4Fe4S-binding SPASM domain